MILEEIKIFDHLFVPDSHRCLLHYYFNEVDAGDEVYVIYCDGAVIGVFKTSDYTLAE